MICDWCDHKIHEKEYRVQWNGDTYHIKCAEERAELDDAAYERKQYLREKWEER